MAHLVVRQSGLVAYSVELSEALEIGRHEGAGLVLHDAHVSRAHASIRVNDQGAIIEDRGSTHGTFVNGARIERADLRDGDEVQVGHVLLTFVGDGAPSEIVHHEPTSIQSPARFGASDARLRLLYQTSSAIRALATIESMVGE